MIDVGFLSFLEDQLIRVEKKMVSHADGYHPDLIAALEHLMSAGGKRIRPIITLLMGSLLGADEGKLISLSASIELLHTATLVHDDLIDGALLRRGNPTLNSHWTPAATVLTGDYIFAQAAGLAAELGSTEAMRLFAETLSTIVNGELSQLFGRAQVPSREDYYHRIYEKTGSLFALSARAPAMISPSDPKYIAPAEDYGREIGKAFQIVDDILDFTGDQAKVGKPTGSDLRQGVPTLPAIYYGEEHPQDGVLQGCLDGTASEKEADALIQRIIDSGAIQKALEEARLCTEKAVESLTGFPTGKERDALEKLGAFIIDRDL
ncbi:MAG: polyprenyl synthetase family protein [Anaerolineales bacterium]